MVATASLSFTDATSGLSSYSLIDTHTHFDAPVFDADRAEQAELAYKRGVRHLVLVGYLYRHFARLYATQKNLNQSSVSQQQDAALAIRETQFLAHYPQAHIALGLHPFYIEQHNDEHLLQMTQMLSEKRPLAIGEIGLDTFTKAMRKPENFAKQQRFFVAQLDMAVAHQLPVMLHIRKAHAEVLALLKAHEYNAQRQGGIAHSFSGGEQEAKAFVKLGFKLGVTGQITNPNAKKLRRAIQSVVAEYGIECLVLETDCPDMTPMCCQTRTFTSLAPVHNVDNEWQGAVEHNRNVPANLPFVLTGLGELLAVCPAALALQLWQNSCSALQVSWSY